MNRTTCAMAASAVLLSAAHGAARERYESGIEETWASFDGYLWTNAGAGELYGQNRTFQGIFWFDHDWTDGLTFNEFASGDFGPVSEFTVGFGEDALVHSGQAVQYVQRETTGGDTEVFFTGGQVGQDWFSLRFYAIGNTDIIIESDRYQISDGAMATQLDFRTGSRTGVWDAVEFQWTDSSGQVRSNPVGSVEKVFLTPTSNTPPDLVEARINGINGDLVLDEKRGDYTLTLDAAATDFQGGVLSFTIDGDGPVEATSTAPESRRLSHTVTRSISGQDTGDTPHTLLFRVTDPAYGYANWTRLVTVRNLDPVITAFEVVPSREGDLQLGDRLAFSAAATDPGGDPLTFLWDLDGDGLYDDHDAAAGSLLLDDPQLQSIALMVLDGDGGQATRQLSFTIVPEPAVAPLLLAAAPLFARRRTRLPRCGR